MRIEEVKIYKFEELTEKVEEKVIEKWYEEESYPFLTDDLKEELRVNEGNIFDNDFKLYYSLSYCQGDGLNIEGNIDIEKCLNVLFPKMASKKKEKIKNAFYSMSTKSYNNHYCYSSKSDLHYDYKSDIDDKFIKYIESEIIPVIQDQYIDLCKMLEKSGYNILSYRMNIEEFTELCEANNYEFYENGKMF